MAIEKHWREQWVPAALLSWKTQRTIFYLYTFPLKYKMVFFAAFPTRTRSEWELEGGVAPFYPPWRKMEQSPTHCFLKGTVA
jgi:hypothetical protein